MHGINRLVTAEKRSVNLKAVNLNRSYSKRKLEKETENDEENISGLGDNIRRSNIHVIGTQERKRKLTEEYLKK